MKRHIRIAAAVLSLPATATAQDLTAHGNFRHMMHTGETGGAVELGALPRERGYWGVGALAGLKGEILLRDGDILVSRGDDPAARALPPADGDAATLLAYGRAERWREIELPHRMDAAGLTRFIEMQAGSLGLNTEGGFPLRVKGRFPRLAWHVVTGGPPRDHGTGHGAGHANARSDMRRFDQPGAEGEIVGVYTGPGLEGVASHPGERLHLHFQDPASGASGHVDEIALPAGAVLLLPEPGATDRATGATETRVAATEGGQAAFAAIQEIVTLLMADPGTDWSRVDIAALRRHLADMDNVTLRARVAAQEVEGGARFAVTSDDAEVAASIRAMVTAHVATMDGVEGWRLDAERTAKGAILTATGDAERIRALGFIGIMTVGMHHQTHHLAIARGINPHDH